MGSTLWSLTIVIKNKSHKDKDFGLFHSLLFSIVESFRFIVEIMFKYF